MIEGYLTSKDVADRLGVRVATVHEYRARGTLPPPDEYVGRSPVWKEATIHAWEQGRRGLDWRKGQS
jgi:predicted DNA-binding transcriptional regulator AlpA